MPSVRMILGLLAWACALFATLQIAQLPGDWGHSICGVWGCGPPLQALLACHLAWCVALVPSAALAIARWPARRVARVGRALGALSVVGLVGVAVYEALIWWPVVPQAHRAYFVHRCAFSVATSIDLPILQLLLTGLILVTAARFRRP